jgi:aryl-alcohol dehydrogenase-like predicted oxidoreductase
MATTGQPRQELDYGAGENERLVGRALAPIRDQVVIATKFFIAPPLSRAQLRKEIRARLDASLARLGTDHVELYYQHRVPDYIPVEDVAAVMGELIAERKILGWGQSLAARPGQLEE